jgi:tetratricopeptide (TPR) repeat protein
MSASDSDAEFRRGTAAALRDDFDTAVAAFERSLASDPESVLAALSLIDAYARLGRIDEADRLATGLLARHPADGGVLVAAARLRERQGRVAEAIELLSGADLVGDLSAYVLYLRLLVEAARYEEALLEAERGIASLIPRPHARLAKGISLLHFDDIAGAVALLDEVDPDGFERVLVSWAHGLRAAGAANRVATLLQRPAAADPSGTAAALRRMLSNP